MDDFDVDLFGCVRFSWDIHNFDMAPHVTGEPLESPAFSLGRAWKKWKFSLLLYPRGSEQEDENYISLFVKRLDDNAEDNPIIHCKFCLIDASGERANEQELTVSDFPQGALEGYRPFCERSLLLGSEKPSLLPDNKLTVSCAMNPFLMEWEDGIFYEFDGNSLSRDFADLLEKGTYSDLIIEADGERFKVHQFVLEARCPKLMEHLAATENSDVVTLPDIGGQVLRAVLHYAYTGEFKDFEKLDEVFVAVNRFELTRLKKSLFPRTRTVSARTEIECFRVSFDWIIPDFNEWMQSNREVSYLLISDDIPEGSWMKASLFAKEGEGGQKDAFLKFLKFPKNHTRTIALKVRASEENGNSIVFSEEFQCVFENGEFAVPFHIGKESLKLLEKGGLKLHFDIRASNGGEQSSVLEVNLRKENRTISESVNDHFGLSADLRHFYVNVKTGDVTLNVGPHKLTAHKAVLCSRSEVFRKMFQEDSLESRTNSVDIDDVEEETMEQFLMFLYCNTSTATDIFPSFPFPSASVPVAMDLYTVAEKYQLSPLKGVCCKYLESNIEYDNVVEVLLFAEAHSIENLKERACEFIYNNARKILRNPNSLDALKDRADLIREALERLSLQKESDNEYSDNGSSHSE